MSDFIPIIILVLVFLAGVLIPIFRGDEPTSKPDTTLNNSGRKLSIGELLEEKRLEKEQERAHQAEAVLNSSEKNWNGIIPVPSDIELIETEDRLLIKGPVGSISTICDHFALMEQLPEGYCMLFGEWRFFILNDTAQSSLELKTVVMPRDHWLFMSCKLRDSILGYDVHPYNYVYEPYTFKQVLEYGIAVEATDMPEDID